MIRTTLLKHRLASLATAALVTTLVTSLITTSALADRGGQSYQVTITNITQGQTFTPFLLTTHQSSIALFELGSAASAELEQLAEGGATGPLADVLDGAGKAVGDVAQGDALLEPGQSVTFTLRGDRRDQYLSLAAMLIPTNDTFVALDTVALPGKDSVTYFAQAYDAGTEANDQSCANMPGPRCGGAGYSPVPGPGDEGFVHVGNGFHELGDVDVDGFEVLGPATYDWRNSVAKITITQKRGRN
jgi:hypothetical protein